MMPTQEQFIEALWESYKNARYPRLEWKFIEWVRDPCVKKLGITKVDFNGLLEKALEDSDEGVIPWDIIADPDVLPVRQAQVARMTPVVVCGRRTYLIAMRPLEAPLGSSVEAAE